MAYIRDLSYKYSRTNEQSSEVEEEASAQVGIKDLQMATVVANGSQRIFNTKNSSPAPKSLKPTGTHVTFAHSELRKPSQSKDLRWARPLLGKIWKYE